MEFEYNLILNKNSDEKQGVVVVRLVAYFFEILNQSICELSPVTTVRAQCVFNVL